MHTHNIGQNARLVRVELSDRWKKTRNGNSASLLSGRISSPTSYWLVSSLCRVDFLLARCTEQNRRSTRPYAAAKPHLPARPCPARPTHPHRLLSVASDRNRLKPTSLCRAVDAFYGTHVAAAAGRPADRAFPLLSKPGRRIVARTPHYKFCSSCPSAAAL